MVFRTIITKIAYNDLENVLASPPDAILEGKLKELDGSKKRKKIPK